NLDIALLDRVRENYSTSITQLETLSSSLVGQNSESEYQFVQSWLCKIKAEKSAKEGLLTIDEFMLAIEDCEICMSNRLTVEDNDDAGEIFEKSTIKEDFTTKSNFYISPNPNDGSFTITLAEPCENCEIRIINSIGQIVKNIKPSQKGLTKITVDGLTTGHYNVVYIIDNKVIDSETVVVK
ncbi:MAG TPA: T9SS type A sorting domain-containing protein, partial [Bacteroidales bacterium]|nr:T9SS type A sorting domain-containing protein [Bacteroidales bacterium]